MIKKLDAEFLGTFWLVLGGCGSAALAAHPARSLIPNDGMTEIITDGRSLILQQQAYSADVSQE